jgi:hypothetical protein
VRALYVSEKMKNIISALLLLATASNFTRAEEAKRDYGFEYIEDLRLEGYEFKFTKAGPADKDGYQWGYFKFRWKGDKPVRLWGFGFEKDGSFSPRFETYSKKLKGAWAEVKVGYCGTGAETYALEPNKDYVFKIALEQHSEDAEQWVVKLDGEKISVVSEPFNVTTKKKKR